MPTSSGIRPNEVSTSSGISPESSEIKQPSYLELDLIYGDGPAECAERLNIYKNVKKLMYKKQNIYTYI